ncbi:enoyl-CoA hydratase/isomerase family protein [Cupriavidus sp. AU9028]|uniref:enoyl-CoA hydratase/isomerase family protein n=1 Tax=Cupriavidus sp. AU9028 TaxID=2871157 RepID=UPI001C96FDE9|nr:enoyl-CoA hydratase-related protein [Cupriavidus sp. AU9028]MBY4898471.1 enoyl-CoA hydratase/isomerase family protein [Cupriavidus sp. AU9028]
MTEHHPPLETLRYEVQQNVAVITLNRPDRMNTLGGSMKPDLARAFLDYARADARVGAVLLTGAGDRAFCAGADIKERAGNTVAGTEYFFAQRATHDLFRDIEEFEKPVLAAINGVALGGGLELALCCDIRIAASTARFGLPEVKLGVIPAAGGTQRLPRLIGAARAKELVLTSDLVDAQTALQYGIVTRVLAPDALMPAALAMAQRIAEQPPLAVRFAKRAINRGLEGDIDSGLEFERYAAAMIIDSEDRKEGMRAFVEKRKPVFTGR